MDRRKDEREQSDDKEARSGIEGQLQCGQHLPPRHSKPATHPLAYYWQAGKQGFL